VRVRPVLTQDFKAYDKSRDSFVSLDAQLNVQGNQQIELEMINNQKTVKHAFNFDCIFGKEKT